MNLRSLLLRILLCTSFFAVAQTRPKAPAQVAKGDDVQAYRNATFGFRYRPPFGWVDRTKEIRAQEVTEAANAAERSQAQARKSGGKTSADGTSQGEVLLAVFERPPEAAGETVNSAVVIAAESAASYPGIKTAEDYVGPLTEITAAKGFKAVGEAATGEIDGRQLVRADFSKALSEKVTMCQTTLVVLTKGQIVSFTFIAGSEDEVNNLIEGLSLVRVK
jgi:hypothetical protein